MLAKFQQNSTSGQARYYYQLQADYLASSINVDFFMSSFALKFHDSFLLSGAFGAVIMFVADLVLYYPTATSTATAVKNGLKEKNCDSRNISSIHYYRTAASYFSSIDPGGDNLAESSMRYVSIRRVMLGAVMGPISSMFYSVGFLGVFVGLASSSQKHRQDDHNDDNSMIILAAIASSGLSLAMTIGAVYHALFAYTCFLSKEISSTMKVKKKNESKYYDRNGSRTRDCGDGGAAALHKVFGLHQAFLRYVYKWAAISCLFGSVAYAYCCLAVARSNYPKYSVLFVPALSGLVKKLLKRYSVGGIVLCGGLTNLWNLCFFAALYLGFSPPTTSSL